MSMRRFLGTMLSVLIVCGMMIQFAWAEYPEKPIQLVIHMGAGSGPDIEGRVFAQELSKVLGQPVIPINKPGGGGAVSYTYVYNSEPDGYTIAWNSMSILTSTNIGNVPFEYDGLEHIGQIMIQPMLICVKADSKWKTAQDFIEDARKNPGTLKTASAAVGSSTHLVTIALQQYAGIDTVMVPLGAVRMLTGLLAGEVDTNTTVSSMIVDMVKAKKVRVLLNTGEERMSTYPDAPTMKELGYDVVLELFRGISVPKGTPPEVKAKLESAMMEVAKTEAMKNLSEKTGLSIKTRNSADFTEYLYERDKQIKEILKKGRKNAREVARAHILLLTHEGKTEMEIKDILRISRATVSNIKKRYREEGLQNALTEKPRSGQPRKYTPKQEAEIIAFTCTKPPKGRRRWTIRLITEKMKKRKGFETLNRETVRLILKKAKRNHG